jgi:hypothetical protein
MRIPLLAAFAAGFTVAAAPAGEPAVTDPRSPAPAGAAARRWVEAAFEAPLLDYYPNGAAGSQAARMLATIQRGESLHAGVGWYDPGQSRYGWTWFLKTFDANGDRRLSKNEVPGDSFSRLDRDRDGAVTAEDFDWSGESAWAKQSGVSLRFFRAIDHDGSGKVSETEMLDYFKKLAGEKGHLNPDDLRDALLQATAVESGKGKAKVNRVTNEGWMKGLFEGDLGSPLDGPQVGQPAPDFTLKTQDGKKAVTLSDYRDKRPVVLVFGSFT